MPDLATGIRDPALPITVLIEAARPAGFLRVADENEAAGGADATRGVSGRRSVAPRSNVRVTRRSLWAQLRKMMLEELQRRNYSNGTIRYHLRAVEEFSNHYGKSPDKLGLSELRSYQAYLLKERKLAVRTVVNHVASLRFFFVRTLKRPEFRDYLPYPRQEERLPTVLSLDEVAHLINAGSNLFRRALLMTVYGTGMIRDAYRSW
jgi:integrase